MASPNSSKLQTKMSAWTPLNHPVANSKFDKWSEGQRKCVLQDFLSRCSVAQLRSVRSCLEQQLPLQAVDFTCMLPRVLSLFIFSHLDPRSLCRCAQVSWNWRGIVELDQLWMPKCVRLGWTLSFSPTPHELSVWKRLYVETVRTLRTARPQVGGASELPDPQVGGASEPPDPLVGGAREPPDPRVGGASGPPDPQVGGASEPPDPQVGGASEPPDPQALYDRVRLISTPPQRAGEEPPAAGRRRSNCAVEAGAGAGAGAGPGAGHQPGGGGAALPPWRHADRHPKDTHRFNYLQMRGSVDHVRKSLSAGTYKLRKAKSQV
ncbi:hypothetical protein CRUP_000091 [Coryphaenoides rupestris]|nr:hypothetical protein CRUP_000091 [Coryphaenoides rupestris]